MKLNNQLENEKENKEETETKDIQGSEFESYHSELGNSVPIIDQILNNSGLTWTTWKIIILTSIILMIDGFHLTLFSSMVIPLTEFYKFSDLGLKLIPGIIFVSVAIGSLSLGSLTRIFSRQLLVIALVFVGLVAHLLMIYIKTITMFAISRAIIGFSLGITTPTSLTIITEYLPMKSRGVVLCCVWCGYTFGQLGLLIIMLIIMPNLEAEKVSLTLIISSILPVVAWLLSMALAEDGPRNLILRGKYEKAFNILEQIYGKPLSEQNRNDIIIQTNSGTNKKQNVDIFEIFNKDYFKTTTLLTFIRVNHAIYYFGILVVSSLTLKTIGLTANKSSDHRMIIISEICMISFIMIGDIMSGFQTNIKWLGRKITMIMDYSLCALCFLLCITFYQHFTVFLAFALFFSSITSVVNHTYCLEVYPTRIRDSATGFLFAWRRLGGFLSQVIYIYLNNNGMWLPYYFTIIILLINVWLVILLPYETYNQILDVKLTADNYPCTSNKEEVIKLV